MRARHGLVLNAHPIAPLASYLDNYNQLKKTAKRFKSDLMLARIKELCLFWSKSVSKVA